MKTIRIKKDEPFILKIEDANGLTIFNQKLHSPTIKLQRGEPMRLQMECEENTRFKSEGKSCPFCGSTCTDKMQFTDSIKKLWWCNYCKLNFTSE